LYGEGSAGSEFHAKPHLEECMEVFLWETGYMHEQQFTAFCLRKPYCVVFLCVTPRRDTQWPAHM